MTELAQKKITDAEWEVMRVVWTNGKATSREIISDRKSTRLNSSHH